MDKPEIVVLCGSTRFYTEFQHMNYQLTMQGKIVLTLGFYAHADPAVWLSREPHGEEIGVTPEQKIMLDQLHKRKIDLADRVFVLNVGGYVGESTRSEIDYARNVAHKPIDFLESPCMELDDRGIPITPKDATAEHCPPSPCQLCKGEAANGMTSWEWCQSVDTCAATIDWDKISGFN